MAGVEGPIRHGGRRHWAGLARCPGFAGARVRADVMIAATDRPAALVVVVVAAEDQVDAVAVEQRQPHLAKPQVGAVAGLGRRERVLVHLHDNPVDTLVLGGLAQRLLQPARLGATAVSADVERRARLDGRIAGAGRGDECRRTADECGAILVDHVVGGEGNEHRRAHPEAVPPAPEGGAVVRQRVSGEIRSESLIAVVELNLVVPGQGIHGRSGGGGLVVVAEVGPYRGLHGRVQVRVAEVAVE